MQYISTRSNVQKLSAAQAIAQGLGTDGGLYTPETLPELSAGLLQSLGSLPYVQRAAKIMSLFLDDFTSEELDDYCGKAYIGRFENDCPAPVRMLSENLGVLELWHGPTCAFKDMALQMLPHLLTASLRKAGEKRKVCILVATSGDTGKAALEGFRDVDHTEILVFYPRDGVSEIQKLQMITQKGNNVGVCAVNGNFDDAQTGVKAIFSDEALRKRLDTGGYFFSSANSINWGRVLPQIVYYVSAYCDLLQSGQVKPGGSFHICVPTGNFGNILAAYYAKKMGVPVGKLICASNRNNVLTDFIRTGVYDRRRTFYNTTSPSMDILISSNLERLLFDLSGKDHRFVSGCMQSLKNEGRYQITDDMKDAIHRIFWADWCGDEEAAGVIGRVFGEKGYLLDPHTAVAYAVLEKYRRETGDHTHGIVVSTASPYKFSDSVLTALGTDYPQNASTALLGMLEERTQTSAPAPLKGLEGLPVRFDRSVDREEMPQAVLDLLKL